jgi:hypothetical protein
VFLREPVRVEQTRVAQQSVRVEHLFSFRDARHNRRGEFCGDFSFFFFGGPWRAFFFLVYKAHRDVVPARAVVEQVRDRH